MPTTEIFIMPMAPGSAIGDPDNQAAVIAKESLETLSKQKGLVGIQFGTQKENPEVFQALINWDSLQAHKDFMATEVYPAFAQRFTSVAGGKPTLYHVDFQPDAGALEKAVAAPVTEVATFLFGDAGVPAGYEKGLLDFDAAILKAGVPGYQGAAFGFTQEEVEHVAGKKGTAAVLVIGWDTVDSHLQFRETEVFKENIGLLRDGIVGADMVHVNFMKFSA